MNIWFLTGSQGLYGEDTLRQVAEQSQRIAAALPVTVEWKGVSLLCGSIEAKASSSLASMASVMRAAGLM